MVSIVASTAAAPQTCVATPSLEQQKVETKEASTCGACDQKAPLVAKAEGQAVEAPELKDAADIAEIQQKA